MAWDSYRRSTGRDPGHKSGAWKQGGGHLGSGRRQRAEWGTRELLWSQPPHCLPTPHPGPALRNPRLDLESRREFTEEYMTFLLPGSASNIQMRNRSTESS